ncbi:hypothetical protein SAMN05216365_1519 [Porphyromonadaceae bacterium NLAE-zl-C104]|nr:hypothetical protein SAMN05216365_1519 [Porphyromonadaceae bacterium NLAE-zl-C104]
MFFVFLAVQIYMIFFEKNTWSDKTTSLFDEITSFLNMS